MTIARKDLEAAAFWEQSVCLDCGLIVEPDEDTCESCGSDDLLPAKQVLKATDLVEEEE